MQSKAKHPIFVHEAGPCGYWLYYAGRLTASTIEASLNVPPSGGLFVVFGLHKKGSPKAQKILYSGTRASKAISGNRVPAVKVTMPAALLEAVASCTIHNQWTMADEERTVQVGSVPQAGDVILSRNPGDVAHPCRTNATEEGSHEDMGASDVGCRADGTDRLDLQRVHWAWLHGYSARLPRRAGGSPPRHHSTRRPCDRSESAFLVVCRRREKVGWGATV